MVNLNMIDTVGSGIRRIFTIQKNRFFPMPDYLIENNRVVVTITGKILDLAYARLLATNHKLSLFDIVLLDKVQKKVELSNEEINYLRSRHLIEGRKPNIHISSKIAVETKQQADYMRQRGIDADYCRKMIVDYLIRFKTASRADFEKILLDKLPSILDGTQKKNKVKNILQSLKNQEVIELDDKKNWRLISAN